MTTDSTMIPIGVEVWSEKAVSRSTRLTSVSTVTVIIVNACVFAVRRACVPGVLDRCQSAHPVSAASTETAAPPRMVQVPARNNCSATS
jgi:hypothetical protein